MEPRLFDAIDTYLRAHTKRHGRGRTAAAFSVSRHTLWRFLERGQPGRALPRAVMAEVGDTTKAITKATRALTTEAHATPRERLDPFLPRRLYSPTAAGVSALGDAIPDDVPRLYPVSRQWFRLLMERLDSVALV